MIRWPLMLAKSVLLFVALMAVVLPDTFQGWQQYLAIFIVVFFTTDVFDMILVAQFRQRIVTYIQEHGSEIQSVV
jgi:threonine/homoserine/homoserine lactone efflux protein